MAGECVLLGARSKNAGWVFVHALNVSAHASDPSQARVPHSACGLRSCSFIRVCIYVIVQRVWVSLYSL